MKIVGVVKIYNEESKGNLIKCLTNLKMFCDDIVIYDDGSFDKSVEIAKSFTDNIIMGKHNEFVNEIEHREMLLDRAVELGANWIFWLDADEIVSRIGVNYGIKKLCELGDRKEIDSFSFNEINLWRSESWYRIDSLFGDGWFNRLWKSNGNLWYDVKRGLHQNQFPNGLKRREICNIKVIHYGFSTIEKIIAKYKMYRDNGIRGESIYRLIDETNLKLLPVNLNWFPSENIPFNIKEKKPEQIGERKWIELVS